METGALAGLGNGEGGGDPPINVRLLHQPDDRGGVRAILPEELVASATTGRQFLVLALVWG